VELLPETEPNDSYINVPNGPPMDLRFAYSGASDPLGDADYYLLRIPYRADVRIQVWGPDGPGTCGAGDNPYLELREISQSGRLLAGNNDDGPDLCPLLSPNIQPAMRQLAAGDYLVNVEDYEEANFIAAYQLYVTLESECGNGRVDGNEACDGTAGCQDCLILPVCGNGLVQQGEQCDDGDMDDSDGCDRQCHTILDHRCTGSPSTCTRVEVICNDGVDNDLDGNSDAADSDCSFSSLVTACAAGQRAVVLTARDTPAAIANPGTSRSVMWVPGGLGTVRRAALKFNIAHDLPVQVGVVLEPPAGAPVAVTSGRGSMGIGYLGTVVDVECTNPLASSDTPFTGCFQPDGNLALLDGAPTQGAWTLAVADSSGHDVDDSGTLVTWNLRLCTDP